MAGALLPVWGGVRTWCPLLGGRLPDRSHDVNEEVDECADPALLERDAGVHVCGASQSRPLHLRGGGCEGPISTPQVTRCRGPHPNDVALDIVGPKDGLLELLVAQLVERDRLGAVGR